MQNVSVDRENSDGITSPEEGIADSVQTQLPPVAIENPRQDQVQEQVQEQDRISSLEKSLRQLPFNVNRLDDGSLEVDLGNSVSFDFDSANFSPSSGSMLDKLVSALEPYTEISLRVVGHTDTKGPEYYNLRLSRRRAAAVAEYLKQHRVGTGSWVRVEGRGESDPVAPGDDERNRRIVLYITPVHQG